MDYLLKHYINQGVLLNLDDSLSPLMKQGELLPNIYNTSKINGSIYAIPLDFTIPMLWGESEIVDQVNSLQDIANYKVSHSIDNLIPYEIHESMIDRFYPFFLDSITDQSTIKSFLEDVKILSVDTCDKHDSYFKGPDHPDEGLLNNYHKIHIAFPTSVDTLMYELYASKVHGNCKYKCLSMDSKLFFKPNNLLAISAESKHQEISKEILQLALSESIQFKSHSNCFSSPGFPVNSKALEQLFDGKSLSTENATNELFTFYSYYNTNDQLAGTCLYWKDYKASVQQLLPFYKEASIPLSENTQVLEILLRDSNDYFANTISLDEATNQICKNLDLLSKE